MPWDCRCYGELKLSLKSVGSSSAKTPVLYLDQGPVDLSNKNGTGQRELALNKADI